MQITHEFCSKSSKSDRRRDTTIRLGRSVELTQCSPSVCRLDEDPLLSFIYPLLILYFALHLPPPSFKGGNVDGIRGRGKVGQNFVIERGLCSLPPNWRKKGERITRTPPHCMQLLESFGRRRELGSVVAFSLPLPSEFLGQLMMQC